MAIVNEFSNREFCMQNLKVIPNLRFWQLNIIISNGEKFIFLLKIQFYFFLLVLCRSAYEKVSTRTYFVSTLCPV